MRAGASRLFRFALAIALASPAVSAAATIRHLEVAFSERTITVDFEVLIAADPERARELLLDCRQWPRLSDTVTEGQLLRTFPDGRERVRVSFLSCIWIFCRTLTQVKDLQRHADGDITARIIPGESDFRSGRERWRIATEPGYTRVRYQAELVPDFSVPPVIGPWFLKYKFRRELIASAEKLEALASP